MKKNLKNLARKHLHISKVLKMKRMLIFLSVLVFHNSHGSLQVMSQKIKQPMAVQSIKYLTLFINL